MVVGGKRRQGAESGVHRGIKNEVKMTNHPELALRALTKGCQTCIIWKGAEGWWETSLSRGLKVSSYRQWTGKQGKQAFKLHFTNPKIDEMFQL